MFGWSRSRRLARVMFFAFLSAAVSVQGWDGPVAPISPTTPTSQPTTSPASWCATTLQWVCPGRRYNLPKPAGHWPPVFYLLKAAWMLAFSASHASILVFLATISASAALCCMAKYPDTIPLQHLLQPVSSSSLCLWWSFTRAGDVRHAIVRARAVARFGRYLDSRNWLHNAWFGVWGFPCNSGERHWIRTSTCPALWAFHRKIFQPCQALAILAPGRYRRACLRAMVALAPRARHEDVIAYGGFAFRPASLFHFAWHWYFAAGFMVAALAAVGHCGSTRTQRAWDGRAVRRFPRRV